jgi:hypothetical protein
MGVTQPEVANPRQPFHAVAPGIGRCLCQAQNVVPSNAISSISDGPNWTDTDGSVGVCRPYIHGGGPGLLYVVVHAHDFARDANLAVPRACGGHVLVPPSGGETDCTGPSTTGSIQETRVDTVRSPARHRSLAHRLVLDCWSHRVDILRHAVRTCA